MLLIYLILLLLISWGIFAPQNRVVFIFLVAILCFLVFFRDSTVGTDVANYSVNFNVMEDKPTTWNCLIPFEPGFNYLILFFKNNISSNSLNCWGAIGIFYTVACSCFFRKYTRNKTFAITLYVLLGTYFLCYNIMRQCFSVAVLLTIFNVININNPTRKELLILLVSIVGCGILFHSTSFAYLILFPYYIPQVQRIFNKKIVIILLFVSFICFATKIIIPILLYFLEHVFVQGKLINYAIRNIQLGEDSGFSLLKVFMVTSFQIYTIYLTKDMKNIFLYMSTFGLLFLNMFAPLVVEFARVYELFVIFQIVYFSQLWFLLKNQSLKSFLYKFSLIIYSLFIYLNVLLKNYGEIVPYEFRF